MGRGANDAAEAAAGRSKAFIPVRPDPRACGSGSATRDRIDNDVFFASGASASHHVVAESVFYHHRPRPPPEVPLAVRTAHDPRKFALLLFLFGWAGILFQRNFLQQVVIGAPVFEELAKLGPPLLVVSILGIRSTWIRLPLAWISGAAFGVMEHYVTYAAEDVYLYAERVLFHAVTPGLSMLFYGAFEDMPDVRARWAATIPATLFHWANNFLVAIVLGILIAIAGLPDLLVVGFATLLSGTMVGITLVAILRLPAFERRARRILETTMPRIGIQPPAKGEPTVEPRMEPS